MLFTALEQTHCALVAWDSKWVTSFLQCILSIHLIILSDVLKHCFVVIWLVPHETAAVSVSSVYTLNVMKKTWQDRNKRNQTTGWQHTCTLFKTCAGHVLEDNTEILQHHSRLALPVFFYSLGHLSKHLAGQHVYTLAAALGSAEFWCVDCVHQNNFRGAFLAFWSSFESAYLQWGNTAGRWSENMSVKLRVWFLIQPVVFWWTALVVTLLSLIHISEPTRRA